MSLDVFKESSRNLITEINKYIKYHEDYSGNEDILALMHINKNITKVQKDLEDLKEEYKKKYKELDHKQYLVWLGRKD